MLTDPGGGSYDSGAMIYRPKSLRGVAFGLGPASTVAGRAERWRIVADMLTALAILTGVLLLLLRG